MSQTQKTKNETSANTETTATATDVKNEELAESTDDLLDEIDNVLEENAEQFVADYIQKGGE